MKPKLKVLFIHHTSVLGGSSKSMMEVIDNLPSDVEPYVICPNGPLISLLERKNIKIFKVVGVPQFDNTRIGHYRNLRWLILLREFFYLPFFFYRLFLLKKEKFDIIHINEITQIFSIIFAKLLLGTTVVHARSLQSNKKNFRYSIILQILKKYADSIIAIDETVKNSLDDSLEVRVIHNGMTLENIMHNKVEQNRFSVGIVSNFQRYKGILDFIDAANICINQKKLDIQFTIFGASYNNSRSFKEYILQLLGFRENLEKIIKEKIINYDLSNRIILTGYVNNSNDIYNKIDLLTFPSHLNAVGRPVFEAAFYKVPSIVAIQNECADTIVNTVTGLCIEEKNPAALADAIQFLFNDRSMLNKMGTESYKLATSLYNSKKNSLEIYTVYINLIGKKADV